MNKDKDVGRLVVIENIKKSIEQGNFNNKVEENDHIVTETERKRVILKYDSRKRKIRNKTKTWVARNITETITKELNKHTNIVGLNNLRGVKTGAIITCNHFSKIDNTVIRYLILKINKKKKFDIIVQESNIFMPGTLGWLLKNNRTIPINKDHKYISENFDPTLKKLLDKKHYVLIYPEEEMWFNYKKPRPGKIGAYHYACKFNVPIVPCFIEMRNTDKIDKDGFFVQKYILHIMPPIYKNRTKNFKEAKEEMMNRDYQAKVEKYEEVYGVKLTYDFDVEKDIAGWK